MAKKIMTPVYLEPEKKEELMRLSKITRVPFAEYVREGVDMVLERYKKELRGGKE